MRRQRLPLTALDADRHGPLLFHQQSLASAASSQSPVQVVFPDSTTSIAVPLGSVREGLVADSRRLPSTDDGEDGEGNVLETSDEIILILSGSEEGRKVLKTNITVTVFLILLQMLLVVAMYSGEVPTDWVFIDQASRVDAV